MKGGGIGIADKLRKLDQHTSVANEFRVRTGYGAALSLATLLAIAYLISTELAYNLTPTMQNRVHVNATTPAGLEMEFDFTFPSIPCTLLSVDANDPTGQAQSLHLDRIHHVWKHRMDKNGTMIGKRSKLELGSVLQGEEELMEVAKKLDINAQKENEEKCGSCYGAGEEGRCCNTCEEVKLAYQRRGWALTTPLHEIAQCNKTKLGTEGKDEGCNVHGVVALSTGGGNLHIAPGHNGLETMGKGDGAFWGSFADFLLEAFEQFNVSHVVNKIRFGDEFPSHVYQLDGQDRMITDTYGMYQYYMQLVPTTFTYLNGTSIQTYQYSVTEHMRHVQPGSGRGLPGVFFFYEVSALHVEIQEYRRGWIHFFTGVCAVVGGVFTVMSMMDRFVFARTRDWGDGVVSSGGRSPLG